MQLFDLGVAATSLLSFQRILSKIETSEQALAIRGASGKVGIAQSLGKHARRVSGAHVVALWNAPFQISLNFQALASF